MTDKQTTPNIRTLLSSTITRLSSFKSKTPLKYIKLNHVILSVLIIFVVFTYFFIFYKLPSPRALKDYKAVPLSSHISDRNGKLLYEVYKEQNRTPVKIKDLPKYVEQATIAIEDKDFYRHGGVSLISGILRAVKDMIIHKQLQGGSTLTQQLVKGALLTSERTVQRKIKEIILALQTEQLFSKQEILEMYLNQVPYGGSAYGIEEAARIYYSKRAKDLTLSEAALLAGLPQAPSLYSPFTNADLAVQRRNEVIQKMYEQKYITKDQYMKTRYESLMLNPPKTSIKAPHFVFYVKSILEKEYGLREIEEGGMRITTTLDLDIQENAEEVLAQELERDKNLNITNGAVLVTRPPTGEILAMVGSADYFATGSGAFNVTTALRQPGSSIKPINYAIGIDRGLVTPASIFLDASTCFPSYPKRYCPVNYDGQFHGLTQLRFALGNSYNIPAVKMLALNGLREFVASSSGFMITTFKNPDNYGLSLTLGGGEVKMTEMAQAFSAFANRGKPRKLNGILEVKNKTGKILYQFKDANLVKKVNEPLNSPNFLSIPGKPVIKMETAYLISHILLDNNARSAAFGPSSYLVVPGHAVSVKTGTTDDKKDNWTIGYTPNFLTAVWVGNNDGTPMNPYLTSGVSGAAPIWNKVMTYILKKQPDLWPVKPENVVGIKICETGQPMSLGADGKESCSSRFEYVIKGTENLSGLAVKKEFVPVYKDNDKQAPSLTEPNTELKEKMVIKDAWSSYCIDCAHDPAPTPAP